MTYLRTLMVWRHPEFLWATLALLVPIIIHLFHFRRTKKLLFPNLRFLRDVELKHRSRNRLRHLLLLFSRLAAFLFLILAFAQPEIGEDVQISSSSSITAIYLDNSLSMEASAEQGVLLEAAKEQALSFVSESERGSRFVLISNEFAAKHQGVKSQAEMSEAIQELQTVPMTRTFEDVLKKAKYEMNRIASGQDQRMLLWSDFQETFWSSQELPVDTMLSLYLIPMETSPTGNLYIDSLWFESPIRSLYSPEQLSVRVVNDSPRRLEGVSVRLSLNNEQKALGLVDIEPYSTADSVITFTHDGPGLKAGSVSLDDESITFDDRMHFAYEVAERLRVMIVSKDGSRSPRLKRVFQGDDSYEVIEVGISSLDFSELATVDLLITNRLTGYSSGVNQSLKSYISEGGSLLVLPDPSMPVGSMNELLTSIGSPTVQARVQRLLAMSSPDAEHALFRGVFEELPKNMERPVARDWLRLGQSISSGIEPILELVDGSPALTRQSFGDGAVFLLTIGLENEESDFAQHSLFVTSILRIAESSRRAGSLFHVLGKDETLETRLDDLPLDASLELVTTSGLRVIPSSRRSGRYTRLDHHGQIMEDGFVSLENDGQLEDLFAFNHDRKESRMRFWTIDQLEAKMDAYPEGTFRIAGLNPSADSSSDIIDSVEATRLWRWCVILALVFLAFEALILKFWRP